MLELGNEMISFLLLPKKTNIFRMRGILSFNSPQQYIGFHSNDDTRIPYCVSVYSEAMG